MVKADDFYRRRLRAWAATQVTQADFIAERNRNWEENAEAWSSGIEDDPFRALLFLRINACIRNVLPSTGRPARITDFGCGEGSFLRGCGDQFPDATLLGVDCCPKLLEIARSRNTSPTTQYVVSDFEDPNTAFTYQSDIAVALLSFVETVKLDIAFGNLQRSLKKGGTAFVAVLDSTREILRLCGFGNKKHPGKLELVNDDLVMISHFTRNGIRSPSPYSRVLRSADRYIIEALSVGFVLHEILTIDIPQGINPFDGPRGIIFSFQKD